MAAVPLFWGTNMVAVTSRENSLYKALFLEINRPVLVKSPFQSYV